MQAWYTLSRLLLPAVAGFWFFSLLWLDLWLSVGSLGAFLMTRVLGIGLVLCTAGRLREGHRWGMALLFFTFPLAGGLAALLFLCPPVGESVPPRPPGELQGALSRLPSAALPRVLPFLPLCYGVCSHGTHRLFFDGAAMAEQMLSDLGGAKHSIALSYYIIRPGVLWTRMLSVLEQRAAAGVRVVVVYDAVGSLGSFPLSLRRRLRRRGVELYAYGPLLRVRGLLFRYHRKLCLIDEAVAYTGGINLSDEYIGPRPGVPPFRDGGIRLQGPAAQGFGRMLAQTLAQVGAPPLSSSRAVPLADGEATGGAGTVYLPVASAPGQGGALRTALLSFIHTAKHSLYMTSPYLGTDGELLSALTMAAGRGVDVRLLLPRIPDKPVVRLMTRDAYARLLAGGVRLYEYTPGFMHQKCWSSDGEVVFVGSVNLDERSLVFNRECGCLLWSASAAAACERELFSLLARATPIGPSFERPRPITRVLQGLLRPFYPLM